MVRRSRRDRKRDALPDVTDVLPESADLFTPPPAPAATPSDDDERGTPSSASPPVPPASAAPVTAAAAPAELRAARSTRLLVSAGVVGTSNTTALTAARAVAVARIASGDPGDSAVRAWIGVDDDAALYALDGQDTVIAYLSPGSWYLTRGAYSRWFHVYDEERDLQGLLVADVARPAES